MLINGNCKQSLRPILALALTLLLVPPLSQADQFVSRDGTHGWELNFVSEYIRSESSSDDRWPVEAVYNEAARWVTKAKEVCLRWNCLESLHEAPHGYQATRFQLPGTEIWVQVEVDPGVIEITNSPITYNEMIEHADFLNEMTYQLAYELELTPAGSAHENLGLDSTFNGDGNLVLRAFTHLQNRPELGAGILGFGGQTLNAPFVGNYPRHQFGDSTTKGPARALEELLVEHRHNPIGDAREVAYAIGRRVNVYHHPNHIVGHVPCHYQAVGLKSVTGKLSGGCAVKPPRPEIEQVFEMRFMGHPKTYAEDMLRKELIERWLNYLEMQTEENITYYRIPLPGYVPDRLRGQVFYAWLVDIELSDLYEHFRPLLFVPKERVEEYTSQNLNNPAIKFAFTRWDLSQDKLNELRFWAPRMLVSEFIRNGMMVHLANEARDGRTKSHLAVLRGLAESFTGNLSLDPQVLDEIKSLYLGVFNTIEEQDLKESLLGTLRRTRLNNFLTGQFSAGFERSSRRLIDELDILHELQLSAGVICKEMLNPESTTN